MKSNWAACYKAVLKHEGGYVNHPKDPGGMTNLGVTKRVWESYIGKPVGEAEMRALTPAVVEPLYRKNYWDAVAGDELPGGLDFSVFDYAVNSGTSRAGKTLQRVVGAKPDGAVGLQTIAKVREYCDKMGVAVLIEEYNDSRLAFLQGLSTWGTFGKGWSRRVAETRETSLKMKG